MISVSLAKAVLNTAASIGHPRERRLGSARGPRLATWAASVALELPSTSNNVPGPDEPSNPRTLEPSTLFLLRQRKHIERLPGRRHSDLGRERRRHQARTAATETRSHRDVLTAIHREAD